MANVEMDVRAAASEQSPAMSDFSVALRASRAAPPAEPYDPWDERAREAGEAYERALCQAERRLKVAGLSIHARHRLLLGSVAPIASYELVVHNGRWVVHIQPLRSTARNHPALIAAHVALAGAWWHWVPHPPHRLYRGAPMEDWVALGDHNRPWRTRFEARSGTRSWSRREGWQRYLQREAAVLAEVAARRPHRPRRPRRGPIRSCVIRRRLARRIAYEIARWRAMGVQLRVATTPKFKS